ncbi:cell division [Paramecium bursaria]
MATQTRLFSSLSQHSSSYVKLERRSTNNSDSTMEEEPSLCDFNFDDDRSPQFVQPYHSDICQYTNDVQPLYFADPNYMSSQLQISPEMRIILLDWLLEVHQRGQMKPHTYFLTLNIMDRYLSRQSISKNKFQLLGATCLFIACKYDEIIPPHLKDIISICDSKYTVKQILNMESEILQVLDFNLSFVSQIQFLEQQLTRERDNYKNQQYYLSLYILELFSLGIESLQFSPSIQAKSALFLSNSILGYKDEQIVSKEMISCFQMMLEKFRKNTNGQISIKLISKYPNISQIVSSLI